MSNRPTILVEIDKALQDRAIHMLGHQDQVLEFIQSPHTAEDSIQMRGESIENQKKISALHKTLLTNKDITLEFRVDAEHLCARAKELGDLNREIIQLLSSDMLYRQREDEKTAAETAKKNTPIDYAMKGSALIGFPTALMGIVEKMGGTKAQMSEAASAGFVVSGAYFYHDLKRDPNIKGLVKHLTGWVKPGPQNIYYNSSVMNARIGWLLVFDAAKQAVGNREIPPVKRLGKLSNRFTRKHRPKP